MRRLRESFSCAFAGLSYCFRTEKNMKIHVLATAAVIIIAVLSGISRMEWGLLVLSVFMVLVAETINTAIEKTVDLVTPDFHPLAGLAKNLAAGAVLLAAFNAVVMAVIIFGPHIGKVLN